MSGVLRRSSKERTHTPSIKQPRERERERENRMEGQVGLTIESKRRERKGKTRRKTTWNGGKKKGGRRGRKERMKIEERERDMGEVAHEGFSDLLVQALNQVFLTVGEPFVSRFTC